MPATVTGEFGCRSTTGDSHGDDRSRGRSPQGRPQDGFGAREWSPRERGTRDTSADFSLRRPGSDVPQGSHSAGERQPRRGVRFFLPLGGHHLHPRTDGCRETSSDWRRDPDAGYLEPEVRDNVGLVVARTVAPVKNGCTVARLLNPTEKELKLHPGSHLGVFHHVKDCDLLTPSEVFPSQQGATPLPDVAGFPLDFYVELFGCLRQGSLLRLFSCCLSSRGPGTLA
ncbi:hypothetical protein F7725_028751, partial [Dissostichus mawsoni]